MIVKPFPIREHDVPELSAMESDLEIADWSSQRAEKRDDVVRIVEYSPFPRARKGQHRQVGFMRDESRGGMCLLTNDRHETGELLRIAVRHVDGRSRLDALASVVWCEGRSDGRYWVGLSLLEAGGSRMMKVRRSANGRSSIGEGHREVRA